MADTDNSNFKAKDIAQMLTWAMEDNGSPPTNDATQQLQAKREALDDLLALTLAEIESSPDVLSRLCVTVHPQAMISIGPLLETKDCALLAYNK